MFTPIFVIGRTPGWLVQWSELKQDPKNIKLQEDQDNYIQETKNKITLIKGDNMSEIVGYYNQGVQMQASKGVLFIDKLLDENIHIPYFCYHQAFR